MNLVATVMERLDTMPGKPFRLIEAAAGLSQVEKVPTRMPAAYVYVKGDVAGENERVNGRVLQRVEADVGICIITGNAKDAKGGAASADIEVLKSAVRQSLLGYVAPENTAGEPFKLVSGEMLRLYAGTVWWEETFGVAYYLEEQP